MSEKRCFGCMLYKRNSPICEHCGYDERKTNAPHQLSPGTVLNNQYLVGKVLGQGGFGITYMGMDQFLDIPVAIKEFYPSGVVTRDITRSQSVFLTSDKVSQRFLTNRDRFVREAISLAKLGRSSGAANIVRVQNLVQANSTAYIIMEYVDGIDLRAYMARNGSILTLTETLRLLLPLMESLEVVHNNHIVHRDISPDNIMVLPDGSTKLIDFGAAHEVQYDGEGSQKSTEAILKYGFAPPEQYQRKGDLGPWTDVYALCATIYYCTTGKLPPNATDRFMGDEDFEWETIPGISPAMVEILQKGTAIRKDDRTQTMAELHKALTEENLRRQESDRQISSPFSAHDFQLPQVAPEAPATAVSEQPPVHTVPLHPSQTPAFTALPQEEMTPATEFLADPELLDPTALVEETQVLSLTVPLEEITAPEEKPEVIEEEPEITEEEPEVTEEEPEEIVEEPEVTEEEPEVIVEEPEVTEEEPEVIVEEPEVTEEEPEVTEEESKAVEEEPEAVEEEPEAPVKPEVPTHRSPAKKAASKPRRRPVWPIAVAAVFACAIGLFLFAKNPASGIRADSPTVMEAPQSAWSSNILMHTYTGEVTGSDLEVYRGQAVFRSELRNDQILSVTFLDTLAQEPSDSWDVSDAQDGSVKAWAIPNGDLYDLYIAAEDGINGTNACEFLFLFFTQLKEVHFGNAFHTESTVSMQGMFKQCEQLTELDLSGFSTANVTNTDAMFEGCRLKNVNHSDLNKCLPYYDPNGWRSNVLMPTHGTNEFQGSWTHYETVPVFGSDIPSSAIRSVTFLDTLREEPEDSWDVSSSENGSVKAWVETDGHLYDLYIAAKGGINGAQACRLMFAGFCNLEQIHFGDAFYTDNATDMTGMFFDCRKLTKLDLTNFDTRAVTGMHAMFQDCRSLTSLDLSSFNTAKVLYMSEMFHSCTALTDLNLNSFDTARTTNMDFMFEGCRLKDVNHSALNKLLPSYDPNAWRNNVLMRTHGIGDIQEEWIRYETAPVFGSDIPSSAIRSVTFLDILGEEPEDSWDVSMARNGSVKAWARKDGARYDLYIAARGGINGAQACKRMFAGFRNLERIHFGDAFHTEGATDMTAMFFDCRKLADLDLTHFDTRAVTSMFAMFEWCESLTDLNLSRFDTSRVRDMGYMFEFCENLTSLDLSNFNTANVTDMRGMFDGQSKLENLDLSSFNTARVKDMNAMFKSCASLKNLDLSSFNTGNVTNMNSMFSSCSSLTKLDLSSFNTAKVTDMSNMFSRCVSLSEVDLSSFDTGHVGNTEGMFVLCNSLTQTNHPDFNEQLQSNK